MKKFTPLIILILISVYFSACQDDDAISPTDVSSTLVVGTWRVSQFSEDDDDETSSFTGYQFTFVATAAGNTGGLIEATNGSSDVVGSWTTEKSDKSSAKLTLSFGIVPFNELNEDWRVTERTDSQIKLEHVSGGNGGTDRLTFEKM